MDSERFFDLIARIEQKIDSAMLNDDWDELENLREEVKSLKDEFSQAKQLP